MTADSCYSAPHFLAAIAVIFGATRRVRAEIALEIIKGHGRAVAAERLGISAGTARIHLQRVFEKTGTHRQAELVRLIADL